MHYKATVKEILNNYPISQVAKKVLAELETSEQIPLATAPGGGGGGGHRYSKTVRAWRYISEELYILLCTDEPQYKELRSKLQTGGGFVISFFSGLLVSKYGLEAGVASSMAALALLIPLQIGIGAWGKAFKDGKDQKGFIKGERDTLIQLVDVLSRAKSNNVAERIDAVSAFSEYSIPAERAVPVLIPLLEDENSSVRFAVIREIERYGQQAHEAIPALLKALNDNSLAVRQQVYFALKKFPSHGTFIVPALVEALKHITELNEYRSNMVALSVFGKEAESAVPIIRKIMQDEEAAGRGSNTTHRYERELYETALWTLQKINEPSTDIES